MKFSTLKGIAVAILAICMTFAFGACSKDKPPKLKGMVYSIPVYVPSEFDWSGDGMVIVGDGEKFHSRCWFLKTDDPREKIIAFYKSRLTNILEEKLGPNAEHGLEENEAVFRYAPEGSAEGEYAEISVRRNEFAICEAVQYEKKNLRD